MKFQNIKRWAIFTLVVSLLSVSCSEDALDDVNKNPNNPIDAPSQFSITDIITSSAFSVTGSEFALYASTYIEHNVGVYNQMYNAEKRVGEPISSSTYNNSWDAVYANLWRLKGVIARCSAGGKEDGNFNNLGIAQILTAYNLAILTDLMGDVPWTEAGRPEEIFQPKLDKQEAIYADIMQLLEDGIANLAKESEGYDPITSQDLLFGGDLVLWEKFAYGLKARYKMRLSLKTPRYQEVIDDINKSFEGSDEEASFKYDGASGKNPFAVFFNDRDYFGASLSLHNKLIARNDPRDAKFFVKYDGTPTLEFAPNGNPVQEQGRYGVSALMQNTNPTYLLSYHELQFLKAEAYARLGNNTEAENAIKKGIETAFVKVGLSTGAADTYYNASVKSLFQTNPLKEIAVQKYVSFFEDEAVEAYNDYRRLKAMGNSDFIELGNPGKFPLRFTYGSSDVTTNTNISAAYGDGQYVYTENVWWAGGTR